MNYKQVIEFLYKQLPCYQRVGAAAYKANLDNTYALLQAIGNPHLQLRCVHVAGTNGKGSVSNLTASILQEAGYTVGLYTSPHLVDFRERIIINGQLVPKRFITWFTKKYMQDIIRIQPSFFEITVAMAYYYFAQQNVDIAVVEVGLGGRLDSTNVINPLVSVITNIGYDHMNLLGSTLPEIAHEKAGIIKQRVPVIIGETQAEIQDVFLQKAQELNSSIIFADAEYAIQPKQNHRWFVDFNIANTNAIEITHIQSALQGEYQKKNLCTVYATVRELQKQKLVIIKQAIRKGIANVHANTGFSGRWHILQQNPLVVCDTAHNVDGIQVTMQQLQSLHATRIHIVWGMVNDKDISAVLPLLPKQAQYYLCSPNINRALPVAELAEKFASFNFVECSSVKRAVQQAIQSAKANEVVYIGGSTFVVAEVLSQKKQKN